MNEESLLGAIYLGSGQCRFLVWAPFIQKVETHIMSPRELIVLLEKDAQGYHQAIIDGVEPGALYFYRLDQDKERPDPASRFQPQGVHGPSQVVDSYFSWQDQNWTGLPLEKYIIYELHAGTFTEEGTFDAIIPYLDELIDLGITAVELMPVNQFPGNRNWGYDGVYPFAVQNSYGEPEGLKRLVNACHQKGLAVVLDVIYNHIGPEGNYFADFGPYFTDCYKTPWGAALNFDGPYSDEVRRFFIENILYWLTGFHIDAFRLDALHAILDNTPYIFIEQLAAAFHKQVEKLGRKAYLIGESSADNVRLIKSPELGGYGLDGQWNDDFHHSLHTLLTGENTGYYQDYGTLKHLAKAFREGFVYSGEYSLYRKRRHGTSSKNIPAERFVVFAQNHDQVGNRAMGDRLSQSVSFEALKLAAGIVLLSPFVPLIFMGEEYGETAPFPYFVSHSEPELIEMVRRGRREDFAAFQWQDEMLDPQDEATFLRAKLNHNLRGEGQHKALLEFYKELIRLRKETPALAQLSKENLEVKDFEEERVLYIHRWSEDSEVIITFNLNSRLTSISLPFPQGDWHKSLDSDEERWSGNGTAVPGQFSPGGETTLTLNPWQFVLFSKEI
jgi:maltooligosyltrehalose trehalohydrolase